VIRKGREKDGKRRGGEFKEECFAKEERLGARAG